MSKRGIITALSAVIVMMAIIGVGVYFLYSEPVKAGVESTVPAVGAQETEKSGHEAHQIIPASELVPARKSLHDSVPQSSADPQPSSPVEKVSPAVPEGPFEVKNSATGKTNSLSFTDGKIVLTDESGKTLWSTAFAGQAAGKVESIDYYNNGKLQFLFACGSKLYLYDRLGRPVSGFPAELGSKVLLGPAAYDFNHNGKYNAVTLNSDNTIQMYNLKGVKPQSWKGIAPDSKVVSLPQLISRDGKDLWVVQTEDSTLVYPFYGGEALRKLPAGTQAENVVLN